MIAGGRCHFDSKDMSLLAYGKEMSGWGAVNIYDWIVHGPTGKRLRDLRSELEEAEATADAAAHPDLSAEENPLP